MIARSLANTKLVAPVNGILANSNLQVDNFTKIVQRVPVLIDFDLPEDIKENKLVPGMSVVVLVRTNEDGGIFLCGGSFIFLIG